MQKRWNLSENPDPLVVADLSRAINVSEPIAKLLVMRGITNFEQAKHFFRPELEQLHDPFLMKGMKNAIDRILLALKNKEAILIYGDYDVDGTTAVSLVYSFFKEYTNNIAYYIPDRYKEGYGISIEGIDFAKANGYSLIIALDCGIKAVEKIEYANSLDIDFIICDHHLPGDEIPDAVAVLDPKQHDCNYPFKELSGCGIGFKLIQAFAISQNIDLNNIYTYLDLVVVSIAADIVPITGENRILSFHGLKLLNTKPRHGLKSLLELSNVKRELTISDIVFIIGPRINAAGRVDSGNKAVELLTSDSSEKATESGYHINKQNNDRRDLDVNITRHALELVDEQEKINKKKSTVVYHPEWHKGVIGIVASRLTEKYYRPTVVLTRSNGMVTGSARSVKDFDLYEAICSCSDLLQQFGGHKYAAGLTLKEENVEAFKQRFEEVVQATITDQMLIPEISIDLEIPFSFIQPKMVNVLKQFAPFGPGNLAPVFLTSGVIDKGNSKIVGNNHIKMDLIHPSSGNNAITAIGFGLGDNYSYISKKLPLAICYSIEENEWNGQTSIQLNVKDIKPV